MSNDADMNETRPEQTDSLQAQHPDAPEWLYRLVLLLIVIAPTQFAYALDPKHGPFIAYADILCAIVVGLWILWRLVARTGKVLPWPPLAVAGLLLTALLSAGVAGSPKASAVEIAQIVLYFVAAYMLFADVLTSRARVRTALIALGIPTALNIAVAAYQYFTADNVMEVAGLFSNRNVYSAYMAMVLPIGFGIMLWLRTPRLQWLIAIGTAGAILTMLSTPTVWIAILVIAALTRLAHRETASVAIGLVFTLAVAIMIIPRNHYATIGELLDPQERGPMYKLAEEVTPDGEAVYVVKKRWLEWKPALNMMAENFVTGVGAGNFQLNIGSSEYYGFLPNVKKSEPDTNNLYLVVGSTMGFGGLVCLVGYLLHFWSRANTLWLKVEQGTPMGMAIGLAGSVVAIALINIFTSLFVRGSGLIWALIFAIIIAVSHGAMGRTSLHRV